MNKKLESFKEQIKGKKAAVLGIGISNTPLIKYLYELGVNITAFDKSTPEKLRPTLKKLDGLDIEYIFGEDYLEHLSGFDIIFRTPGIRFDLPQIETARKQGAIVTSEMEIFLDLCPSKTFAVTGSDGKTTTTSLIYEFLKEEGYKCWLGGNIGFPLLSKIDEISPDDMIILELSSFQLQTMTKSADIAVITNLSPNHLDYHKDVKEYYDAKKNIYKFQDKNGKLILNYDNEITKSLEFEAKGNVIFFSRCSSLNTGTILNGDYLGYVENGHFTPIVNRNDIFIKGNHNVENFLAAFTAVYGYVKPETMAKVAKDFKGVEHRNQFVREIKNIKFYNDSIASSPSRTKATLSVYEKPVILIAGGKDKGIPYDDFGYQLLDKVKKLVLLGQTAQVIEKSFKKAVQETGKSKDVEIIRCANIESAVETAYKVAEPGDIILLSPASTSFDMFKNFEERGNRFKDCVMELK